MAEISIGLHDLAVKTRQFALRARNHDKENGDQVALEEVTCAASLLMLEDEKLR